MVDHQRIMWVALPNTNQVVDIDVLGDYQSMSSSRLWKFKSLPYQYTLWFQDSIGRVYKLKWDSVSKTSSWVWQPDKELPHEVRIKLLLGAE